MLDIRGKKISIVGNTIYSIERLNGDGNLVVISMSKVLNQGSWRNKDIFNHLPFTLYKTFDYTEYGKWHV